MKIKNKNKKWWGTKSNQTATINQARMFHGCLDSCKTNHMFEKLTCNVILILFVFSFTSIAFAQSYSPVYSPTASNSSALIVARGVSSDGSVHVTLTSTPIELHQPLALQISFTDPQGNKIPYEHYGISALQQVSNGVLILSNYSALAVNGDDIQVTNPLENPSPVNFDIQLQGSGPPDTAPSSWTGPSEDVDITIGEQFSLHAAISHVSTGAQQVVTIPLGAYNPRYDTVAPQWYLPSTITVGVNQTVTWLNQDNEIHTVTSGQSSGREGLMRNGVGIPNGLFDSGPIKPGLSWTHVFTHVGTFEYFCTIHPWMQGFVTVQKSQPIPVDADGNKITKFPVVRFTSDNKIEVDLGWEPHCITTGQNIIFVFQFYDNVNFGTIPAHYVFTIEQNGEQLYTVTDATESGGDYKYFQFDKPGLAVFKFDDIDNTGQSVQFSTMVDPGNSTSTSEMNTPVVEPARNLELSWWLMPLFFVPCFIAICGVYVMKKRKRKQKIIHTETSTKKTPI
ncbi:MAG: cupredoxin domain-containing protein [Nitrosotalea sp.]